MLIKLILLVLPLGLDTFAASAASGWPGLELLAVGIGLLGEKLLAA
ncbi:MAG: hypothetical protein QOF77_1598 [Solirubrobacteraceae bacterium]|nr:hypothetical protein [Solirubrobacteraceae bacterium]